LIAYFDTSAFVPLLIKEPTSAACQDAWLAAELRVSSVVLQAETAAALGLRWRLGHVSRQHLDHALGAAAALAEEASLVAVTLQEATLAGELAIRMALRGYDAVHVATSLAFNGPDAVGVAADRVVLAAWEALGLATIDVNAA